MAARQRENPTTSTLRATRMHRARPAKAQERGQGAGPSGTTQPPAPGQTPELQPSPAAPRCSSLQPAGLPSTALPSPCSGISRNITWENPAASQLPTIPLGICLQRAGSLCQEGKGLRRTGTFPQPDGSHGGSPRGSSLREPGSPLPRAGAALLSQARAVPECYQWYGQQLPSLPENKVIRLKGWMWIFISYFPELGTDPLPLIALSSDMRSVHWVFLLLICLTGLLAERRECVLPVHWNPAMQNSTGTTQQASDRAEFSEGKK